MLLGLRCSETGYQFSGVSSSLCCSMEFGLRSQILLSDDSDSDNFEGDWDDDVDDAEDELSPSPPPRNPDASGPPTRVGLQDFQQELSVRDKKIKYLLEMGFPEDEAEKAITRCGLHCPMYVLLDSIHASQATTEDDPEIKDTNCIDSTSLERKKSKRVEKDCKKRKRLDCRNEDQTCVPNPMVGLNLPGDSFPRVNRKIPSHAIGSPFFYLGKVAGAPQGVWETISRFLYDVKEEIVDSKFFSASTRKTAYLHNLPVDDRYALPSPPKTKTILEAFPHCAKWWPWWDQRLQLDCFRRTRLASAELLKCINCILAENPGNPPAETVRKHVLEQCRIWNLLWVGKNRVAALEPHEMELILGYPKDHTRGVRVTERYRYLGNSLQVDTIVYHLSVLKKMFPNGVNVLSLFSGIGGAKVALHRLGIKMNTLVSVETSAVNKRILKSWWDETQKGRLIQIDRVESLTHDRIESLVREVDGFQLVIGGSPCNDLTGSNGLEGEHSALFHHYVMILCCEVDYGDTSQIKLVAPVFSVSAAANKFRNMLTFICFPRKRKLIFCYGGEALCEYRIWC